MPRRQRRVSLAASDTGRAGRGGHFRQSRPPKSARDCRLSRFAQFADRLKIIQLHRFDPTWPQHWLDLGSTSASKAPTSAQLGSKMAQLGSKRRNLAPSSTYLGATSAQVEDHIMASKWGVGPSRPASFLSVLFSGCGRFLLRSDSNMVHMGAPSCTQPNFVGNNNETR